MEWKNEQILEFINVYEKYPALWDCKHPDHKNRNRLNHAWLELRNEFNPELQISDLKKKKESLMSTYRSLRRKLVESETTGQGQDDIYKPWFAYNSLDRFLRATGKKNTSLNSEGVIIADEENFPENDLGDAEKSKYPVPDELNLIEITESHVSDKEKTKLPLQQRKRKREVPSSTDQLVVKHLQQASNALQSIQNRHTQQQPNQQQDACSLYGQLVSEKLRNLNSRTRLIVQNQIDNLLFKALMNDTDTYNSATPTYTSTPIPSPSIADNNSYQCSGSVFVQTEPDTYMYSNFDTNENSM